MSLASIIKLIRMGVLSGIGAPININTFGGGAYSKEGTYWMEGAISNPYGTHVCQWQICCKFKFAPKTNMVNAIFANVMCYSVNLNLLRICHTGKHEQI